MFYSPKTLAELLLLLQKRDSNLKIIAGGTDLLVRLQNQKNFDADFLDIMKIKELQKIEASKQEFWIGAAVTMTDLCHSSLVKDKLTALYLAAYHLGSEQIRNRATLGGAIANASQSSDPLDVLFAYQAEIEVMEADGTRKCMPIREFITGKEKNCLLPGEIVSRIRIPQKNRRSVFGKVGARKAVTIAKINCTIDYEAYRGRMEQVSVYLGAVGAKPVEAHEIEALLEGKKPGEVLLPELQKTGRREIENAIPTRPSRFYKRVAIEGLLEDLMEVLE